MSKKWMFKVARLYGDNKLEEFVTNYVSGPNCIAYLRRGPMLDGNLTSDGWVLAYWTEVG